MRKVCGHKPGAEVKFVPTSFGNDRDDDPVTVWYRSPSERERRRLLAGGDEITVRQGDDGKPVVKTTSASNVDRQTRTIEALVVKVKNYTGRKGPIANGEDLAEHGETEIVTEVFNELTSNLALTDDEQKKSPGPSGSPGRATRG